LIRGTVQYWLAELDQHGNPTLIDGAHSDAEGANQAAYLIQAIGLGKRERNFAVARVELTECVPSSKGVNQRAVALCRGMAKGALAARKKHGP